MRIVIDTATLMKPVKEYVDRKEWAAYAKWHDIVTDELPRDLSATRSAFRWYRFWQFVHSIINP